MDHKLTIRNLGPIQDCSLSINHFTVFTGPQSNGKSTVAKAIYFFRSVKQDILQLMMMGGPKAMSEEREPMAWGTVLTQKMRQKYTQLFGLPQAMAKDMSLLYSYTKQCWIKVGCAVHHEKYTLEITFSPAMTDYCKDLDTQSFLDLDPFQKAKQEQKLSALLDDPYETVFVPAGRNLITLLSTQLNYIFTSLEGSQLRNIDYVTKRYTELILKLKPYFSGGMDQVLYPPVEDILTNLNFKKHSQGILFLREKAQEVLQGVYQYVDGEERLYLDDDRYVKINMASSGQQEIVWVFNLLFYYLIEDKQVFLILEEPESHLYPESQRIVAEVLAAFLNEGNAELITTHSPYILGTVNYLLLAGQIPPEPSRPGQTACSSACRIDPNGASAYHIHDGIMASALDTEGGLTLIDNALIDGASDTINSISDQLLTAAFGEDPQP